MYSVNGHELSYTSYPEGTVLKIFGGIYSSYATHPWLYIGSYEGVRVEGRFDCFLRMHKNQSATFQFSNPNIHLANHDVLEAQCAKGLCQIEKPQVNSGRKR